MEETEQDAGLEDQDQQEASPEGGSGRIAKILARLRRNWRRVGAVAVTVLLLCAVAIGWLAWKSGSADRAVTFEIALKALDAGAYSIARDYADILAKRQGEKEIKLGYTAFLQGIAIAGQADLHRAEDRRDYYLLSAASLDDARVFGFPKGREAEGMYALGRSLFLGGQIRDSRPILREALALNPENRASIHELLSQSYAREATPDYETALKHNASLLAIADLPSDLRRRGTLQRVEILNRLGHTQEARTTLDETDESLRSEFTPLMLLGQILISEARQLNRTAEEDGVDETVQSEAVAAATGKYREAIELLKAARHAGRMEERMERQAAYLIGICYGDLQDYKAAHKELSHVQRAYPETPEGIAASFRLGKMSTKLGNAPEAVARYRWALKHVRDVTNYDNPWLPLEELQTSTRGAYQRHLDQAAAETTVESAALNYKLALALLDAFVPTFSRSETTELEARVHFAWALQLQRQSAAETPPLSEDLRFESFAHFHTAGELYEELARRRTLTRTYPDALWKSAQSYYEGQDYASTIPVLTLYLKNEARLRQPLALLYLGESWLNLGYPDKTLEALNECIQFYPRDPAVYRARLMASFAHAEKGDAKAAESLLQENLNGVLGPKSVEWRDSLFALGRLLFEQGEFTEAAKRMNEAIVRYEKEGDPRTIESRYLLGQCYLTAALSMKKKVEGTLVDAVRQKNSQIAQGYLNSALSQFDMALEVLNTRQDSTDLTDSERKMLRNCYFASGSTLLQLGRYEDAIKTFESADQRYQNASEHLEALTQIAHAQRMLGQPEDARTTIEKAIAFLERMPPEQDFTQTTNLDPQQWADRLAWLANL